MYRTIPKIIVDQYRISTLACSEAPSQAQRRHHRVTLLQRERAESAGGVSLLHMSKGQVCILGKA